MGEGFKYIPGEISEIDREEYIHEQETGSIPLTKHEIDMLADFDERRLLSDDLPPDWAVDGPIQRDESSRHPYTGTELEK